MASYIKVLPGEKYGCYTVLSQNHKKGKQEFYNVKCVCGAETVLGKSRLRTCPSQCKKCAGKKYTKMMTDKRKELIGTVVNGFRILDIASNKNTSKAAKFLTECVICGTKSVKTISAMNIKKGERCQNCPPDYKFKIINSIAIGTLTDGTKFKIDAEDIDKVSRYHWYVNGGGYLFRRESTSREPCRLHRMILGLSKGDKCVVDHLNHDKLDNRKCNLSVGTQADNCKNNILRCSNTIGYVGVRISENKKSYTSKIEMGGKEYVLIKTYSIEDAAQAYNVAADYLFGIGVGYRNEVLYPSQKFACSIVEKIKEIQKQEDKIK